MKRMNEVFELPLIAHEDIIVESTDNRCAEFDLYEQAQCAAHAINNVDTLADTLETVLAVLSGKTEFSSSEIDIDSCYAALNAYRGAK